MYLIPRMIGIGVYTLGLMLISFFMMHTKEKYVAMWLKVYIVVLAMMAFFYVPTNGADLYRLIPIMHIYTNMSVNVLIDTMLSSSTPGVPLYYHLIGQLGMDGLLPATTAFLTYTLAFSVLLKCYKKVQSKKRDVVLILMLFMSRGLLQVTISNIRTVLAMTLVGWCIYTELDLKRSTIKNSVFYIMAASLHVMGQFMVLIRIALFLVEKSETTWHKIAKLMLSTASIAGIIFYGESYVENFVDKAEGYIVGGQQGQTYFYFWEALLSILSIMVLLYLMYKISLYRDASSIKDHKFIAKKMLHFLTILAVFNLAILFFEFNFAFRFSFFVTLLNIPMGLYCLKCVEATPQYIKVRNNLLIVSCVMLAVAVTRGDLSSLKFF